MNGHQVKSNMDQLTPSPPRGMPTYRLLTGKDDDVFCQRVSEALAMGYELYGSPTLTFNGDHCVAGQAIVWGDRS
jgi:hypothetical protein